MSLENVASILIVDAEDADRMAVASELRGLGHEVGESATASKALQVAERLNPDLMVLGWSLPDAAGLDVLQNVKRIGQTSATRVLMTSSEKPEENVVLALNAGADDFVSKPFAMPELLARLGACLRRPATVSSGAELRAGGIMIDAVAHRVFVDGDSLTLAPREYRLLSFLMTNRDRVYSRRQLLTHVWDRSASVGVRTVDVHVRRLRSLLEPYQYDHFLQTVRGSGYRFSPDA